MVKNNGIILSCRGIRKGYAMGHGRQEVLRGVDLAIRRGEFLAIMGASGSGKSTLLHIMGLLDRPDDGHVSFEARDIFTMTGAEQNKIRNQDMGFVFQFYHLLPELNVLENIMLPIMVGSSIWSWFSQRSEAKKRATELISAIGLTDQARQRPATLSGGERQRVALARALMAKPKILLADEPTGNLDSAAGNVILELLCKLNNEGQTIVIVTHDEAVAEVAHRKLRLKDGILN